MKLDISSASFTLQAENHADELYLEQWLDRIPRYAREYMNSWLQVNRNGDEIIKSIDFICGAKVSPGIQYGRVQRMLVAMKKKLKIG